MTHTLQIAHLYGDLMNTYGDYGNIIALRYYAEMLDVTVTTDIVSLGASFNADAYDFALFGGGQDYEQQIVAADLPSKAAELTRFIEADGPLLAICGGYQLIGDYMVMANGTRIDGIKALPHYSVNLDDPRATATTGRRLTGDVVITDPTTGEQYHGFENHQARTFLAGDEAPLGTVVSGQGNNGIDGTEGVVYRNVYGSYFHGPILTRNGNLAKRLLTLTLNRKYPDTDWAAAVAALPTESF